MTLNLRIGSFKEGDMIERKYTCDGEDISPSVSWTESPENTKSFALILDDPDAPIRTFVHWVVYNIPPSVMELEENYPKVQLSSNGIMQGKNDFGKIGYGGPCPPGQKAHRYVFHLFSTGLKGALPAGLDKKGVLKAIKGSVIMEATFMLTYKRDR